MVLLSFCLLASQAKSQASLDDFAIELSPQAQEAINNGVSLTIDCDFANIENVLIFNRKSNETNHRFTLSRHALSNRYMVKQDSLSRPRIFRTIPEATHYISTQAVALLETYTIYNTDQKMRLSLNKFELPGPMRLQAFIFDEWDLDTGWIAWKLES